MDCRVKPGNDDSVVVAGAPVRRSLNMRGRRNSKSRRRTGPAFQGSSSGASIVGCQASALARIFVDRSDAAAGLHALGHSYGCRHKCSSAGHFVHSSSANPTSIRFSSNIAATIASLMHRIVRHRWKFKARLKRGSPGPSATGGRWSIRCRPTSEPSGCAG
jgi:hypothetical protein